MEWIDRQLGELLAHRAALPHALLLAGRPAIGKSTLAWSLARALLCEAPEADGRACGRCAACGWVASGSHPDLRRVSPEADDAAEQGAPKAEAGRWIRIDQIRELAGFVNVGAHRAGRKVVVIDPADALNVPAANALLKTLEEPPGQTVFLLVTSRPDALPATIRSRCVAHPVAAPGAQEALAWLAAQQGVGSVEQARLLLAAAGGLPLRALALADPAQAAAFRALVDGVARIPEVSALRVAEALFGEPARAWVPLLQAWVADLARVAVGSAPVRYPDQCERLARLASSTTLERVAGYAHWLDAQARALDHPLNPRLLCEDLLLRYHAIFD